MQKKYIYFSFVLVIIASCALFFFGNKKITHPNLFPKKKSLAVLCTTSIITDLVKAIAEPMCNVKGLMGPGIDPHLYRPREGDMEILLNTDVIFYNGLHLEGKMADLFAHMQRTKAFAVTDGIEQSKLRSTSFDGIYDPHIWTSVPLWIDAAQYICKTLCHLDPANASQYQIKTKDYTQELMNLHSYIQHQIQKIPQSSRTLITAHDAFAYFGQTYGINVLGLQGISTDTEPGSHDVQKLADYVVNNKIPALFTEISIPERTMIAVQHAAQAAGWNIALGKSLYSDSLGTPNGSAGTYIDMMRYNIDVITAALSNSLS